jgi:hypothetical protein
MRSYAYIPTILIIEEERKREEQRRREERPALQLPLPEPPFEEIPRIEEEEEPQRGVIIIDLTA